MSKYDMTFDPLSVHTLSEGLHALYFRYGKGKITIEQFFALYLENKLDDYIKKVKADE